MAEIDAEQEPVAGDRELIRRFEKKIEATIAGVWCEAPPALPCRGHWVQIPSLHQTGQN